MPARRLAARSALVSLLAPPCCAGCREPLDRDEPICDACCDSLPRLHRPEPCCGLPRHGRGGCPATGGAIDGAWAPFAHSGAARAVVLAFKVGGRLPLAGWMAGQMAPGVPRDVVLVPVPAAPGRRRARGFDPAALLARELAATAGVLAAEVLRRRDGAARQVGAPRDARRAPGRIRVEAVAAPPAWAVLVDDVHTTGATLDACARALRDAGARRVTAVTFARTV